MTMKFSIIPYMLSRRTQYPMYKVTEAIERLGLTYQRPIHLIEVEVPEDALVIKRLETALRAVHRNIPYRKELVR